MKAIMLLFLISLFLSCNKREKVALEKYEINSIKIDTIKYFPDDKIYLLNQRDHGHLGEFINQYIFVKKDSSVGYKIIGDNFEIELSNKYIGLVNIGDKGVGWFSIKNHKISKSLPKIDSILLLLEEEYKGKFIQESNGVFTVLNNGSVIETINYGEFLGTPKIIDYESLEYGIYKCDNDTLMKVNDNGKILSSQRDGLYFIPSPGYKTIALIKLSNILQKVKAIESYQMINQIEIQ